LLLAVARVASGQATPPGVQTLTLSVPVAGAVNCQVIDDGQVFEDVGTFGGAQATFNLQLEPLAAAGTYSVSLVCGAGSESVQITVPESQQAMAGHPLLSTYSWDTRHPAAPVSSALTPGPDSITGVYSAPGQVPYMTAAQRRSAFDGWLRHQNAAVLAAPAEAAAAEHFDNSGQCTTLAAVKRPDIVRAIVLGLYAKWMASSPNLGSDPAITNWDASNWAMLARGAGVPVGLTPRPGALMVFHSDDLARWPGHIAYVDRVGDGVVYVTQEHAPALGVVTEGTYPAAPIVRIADQNSAVSYIY
jgi:hypothetical protein